MKLAPISEILLNVTVNHCLLIDGISLNENVKKRHENLAFFTREQPQSETLSKTEAAEAPHTPDAAAVHLCDDSRM